MSTVRKITLQILSEQPNQEMKIVSLSRQLSSQRALGFGVEVEDVVSALVKDGKVIYNRETDTVKALNTEEQNRFQLELERRSCLAAASELSRGDALIDCELRDMVQKLLDKAESIKKKLHGT